MVDYILRRCLSPEPAAHPVLIQPRALEMWQGFPRTVSGFACRIARCSVGSHQVMMPRVQNMWSFFVRRRNAPLVLRSKGGKVTRQGLVLRTAHVLFHQQQSTDVIHLLTQSSTQIGFTILSQWVEVGKGVSLSRGAQN
jgi:hypothetical protein